MNDKLILMPIDIITPLKNLEKLAASQTTGEFNEGYLMAIGHAIELAEIQQQRIDQEHSAHQLESH